MTPLEHAAELVHRQLASQVEGDVPTSGVVIRTRRRSAQSAARALLATVRPMEIEPELLGALEKALSITSNPARVRHAMDVVREKITRARELGDKVFGMEVTRHGVGGIAQILVMSELTAVGSR